MMAYKRKIENIFDLKEKQEMEDKKVMSEKKFNIHRPDLGIRKLADLEKKLELERFRRENALINNVNNIQDKINKILVKKEEKEKNILKTKESEEKKREEKLMLNNLKYEEVINKVKKNINVEKAEEHIKNIEINLDKGEDINTDINQKINLENENKEEKNDDQNIKEEESNNLKKEEKDNNEINDDYVNNYLSKLNTADLIKDNLNLPSLDNYNDLNKMKVYKGNINFIDE